MHVYDVTTFGAKAKFYTGRNRSPLSRSSSFCGVIRLPSAGNIDRISGGFHLKLAAIAVAKTKIAEDMSLFAGLPIPNSFKRSSFERG